MNTLVFLALVTLTLCRLGTRPPVYNEPYTANSKEFNDASKSGTWRSVLDHYDFNILSNSMHNWDQRYFVQTPYYKPELNHEKVMVIEIGAEAAARYVKEGEETAEIAKKYNAVFFVLEHRFFSDKPEFQPTDNVATESLRYLTTYNALFDLVEFIFDKDEEYRLMEDPNSEPAPEGTLYHKWIILGGSYPGALAGFIAQQFPHIFTASISSSGVVNAMYELPQFDEHTYAASGNICGRAASIAMREIQDIVNANPKKNSIYYELGIQGEDVDRTDFAYYMADSNVMGIQYSSWNTLCDPLIKAWTEGTSLKDAFIKFLKEYHPTETSGFSTYDRRIIKKHEKNDIPTSAFRNWWYCTCAEWGFFQPMPEISPIRTKEVSMQWHRDFCKEIFNTNELVTPGSIGDPTVRTNTFYGALKVYGPRTLFLNYWQDPWKICSIREPTENAPNVVFVQSFNYGHCADFHIISDKERNYPGDYEMREMRNRVDNFITNMVAEFNKVHV